ncbi:MAG TPA: aldose epimerase family protein [Vicinamibacterales bacterium]|nr:aldose epimerase family protein [Vicinamibacterales bacterium]
MPRPTPIRMADGRLAERCVLSTSQLEMHVVSYGAIITSLRTPCRDGRRRNIVLGLDDVAAYTRNPHYLGAVVGRYANRIANGRFSLDGEPVQLATNDGAHHLHGGTSGFDQQVWTIAAATTDSVSFRRTSPSGEEHYPGQLDVSVIYRLTAENVVELRYAATADRDTPVNLTQHSYFNLSGDPASSILDHELSILADAYTPVDATLIPEGMAAAVAGTPFDFRTARNIGAQLSLQHEQLRRARGFDHNWILRGGGARAPAARLRHPASGRVLEVATTEPGLQFYAGQLLAAHNGSSPSPFAAYAGLCLETQHFPDSPNRPDFPTTILRVGQRYESLTTWSFSLD